MRKEEVLLNSSQMTTWNIYIFNLKKEGTKEKDTWLEFKTNLWIETS
jgi:hypothetical protein